MFGLVFSYFLVYTFDMIRQDQTEDLRLPYISIVIKPKKKKKTWKPIAVSDDPDS